MGRRLFRRLRAPISMQIEVTSACNCKCVHCYNYWRDKSELALIGNSPPANMTIDTAKRVLEQCVENELFDIVLTGGEPFLNFPIMKWLAEEFIRNKIKVSINSNLTLITDEQADWLTGSGVRGVLTSVLGHNAEIHDKITSANGSFDATMHGIDKLLKHDFYPSVNCVVSKLNFQYIKDIYRNLANKGIKMIAMTPVIIPTYCSDSSWLAITRDNLVQCLNIALAMKEELNVTIDSLSSLPICSLDGVSDIKYFSRRHCGIGRTQLVCSADGTTRACPNFDVPEGNLLYESLQKIWTRYENWNDASLLPEICRDCKLFGLCTGGCRMAAKSYSGNHCSPDPRLSIEQIERVYKQLLAQTQSNTVNTTDNFLVKDYRLRREDFGAVMAAGDGYIDVSFVASETIDVLSSFEVGRTYSVNDVMLNYSEESKLAFLTGMSRHKVIEFV